ncbi:uncharacterized protein LOC122010101 [Zingiber officinale]|nr:uncharacterized protein LOC122010101 [Zingiber officinale]
MGCFLRCFKGPKDRNRRRSPRRSPSRERRVSESCLHPIPSAKQISPNPSAPELFPPEEVVSVAVALPVEKKKKNKENVEKENAGGGGRKKVTFDLNVKTYERVPSDEDDEEEEKPAKGNKDESYPKSGAFPSNHRYENCESSDDDRGCESGEDEDEFESDFEIGIQGNEEESYDSFFSLPLDKDPQGLHEEVSSRQLDSASAPLLGKQSIPAAGGCGGTRDRSQFVHSVLNPIENLSQWKEIKVRASPAKNPDKQNLGNEPEIKVKKKKPQVPKQEVSVDGSLSNWLPSSPDNSTAETPQPSNSHLSNSSFSREDRPILGALTMEEIKQSSMTSSPSKSPPADEIPILGTVGRYWSCENPGEDTASSRRPSSRLAKGIPNTTSKDREVISG